MPEPANPILSEGKSHIGAVREENQDAIQLVDPALEAINTHGYLYGLADGLGGYEHGGIASNMALETLFHIFYSTTVGQAEQNFVEAYREANERIFREGSVRKARMGTTLTALNIVGNTATIAHVGDSRLYLIRRGRVMCLTNDHSTVGDMVRARLLAPDKLRTHSQRSVLNRCLGIEMNIQTDISQVKLQAEDRLLMCSDGFWSVVEDHELPDLLTRSDASDGLCNYLIEEAIHRGSDDNISVIYLRIQHLDATGSRSIRRLMSFFNSILPHSPDSDGTNSGHSN